MSQNSPKINVQRLLKLKRAERPDPVFWEHFQKEFRQRQLQTLIVRQSTWSQFLHLIWARRRLLTPISGLALIILVLSLNFINNSPPHNEFVETAALTPTPAPEPVLTHSPVRAREPALPTPPARREAIYIPAISTAPASFVVDVIPAELPEAPTYTQEFPTPTIRSNSDSLATYASYTIRRDTPIYASTRYGF